MNQKYTDPQLVTAFQAYREKAADGLCPTAEMLYAALTCEMGAPERAAIVAHLSVCGSCAEDWRITKNYLHELDLAAAEPQLAEVKQFPLRSWILPFLVAAAGVIVALLIPLQEPRKSPPLYREAPSIAPIQNPNNGAVVHRETCRLAWHMSEASPTTQYTVQVSGEDLFTVLYRAEGLTEPQVQVPAAELEALADGSQLLWWVEANLSDGKVLRSPTFTQKLMP